MNEKMYENRIVLLRCKCGFIAFDCVKHKCDRKKPEWSQVIVYNKEALEEAKKEVFDDIEKEAQKPLPIWFKDLKKRHLSTFQKKSKDKQNPQKCNHAFNDIGICEVCHKQEDDCAD